jgi:hypothetical protein
MMIGDHAERIKLAVTNLRNINILLGLDWLRFHNPSIDWPTSEVLFDKCPHKCGYVPWWVSPEEEEHSNRLGHGEKLFVFNWEGYIHDHGHIHAVNTTTDYINEYPKVFTKKGFDKMPERQPWDYAIKLAPGSNPVDCKIYPLSPIKQKALDEFLEGNLKSGCI